MGQHVKSQGQVSMSKVKDRSAGPKSKGSTCQESRKGQYVRNQGRVSRPSQERVSAMLRVKDMSAGHESKTGDHVKS